MVKLARKKELQMNPSQAKNQICRLISKEYFGKIVKEYMIILRCCNSVGY